MKLNDYEQQLLDGWEEISKRGQLTTWIMLALKDGAKHMAEIKDFTSLHTKGNMIADDQSMYRALRRFKDAEMVSFKVEPGDGGGERKVYFLTQTGVNILNAFLQRNIIDLFYNPEMRKLIEEKE